MLDASFSVHPPPFNYSRPASDNGPLRQQVSQTEPRCAALPAGHWDCHLSCPGSPAHSCAPVPFLRPRYSPTPRVVPQAQARAADPLSLPFPS